MVLLLACCTNTEDIGLGDEPEEQTGTPYHQVVIQKLNDKPDGYVMIMAHRGDWKNAPENSIAGIQRCIDLGLDMVEVDVKKTKDGKLILMHDNTLDRTTDGHGNVSDFTWDELKKLRLRDANGFITDHSIPLLEEAMLAARDKIFVFVDKSYEHLNEVYRVLQQTGTLGQAAVDGIATFSQYKTDYPDIWREMNLVPRVGKGQPQAYIDSHIANEDNVFFFPSCNLALAQSAEFQRVVDSERWLMFSTLSSTSCSEDFESAWVWAIDNGMDIIITDKPKALLGFLRKNGKHL